MCSDKTKTTGLKIFLGAIYVVLAILLLLASMCCRQERKSDPPAPKEQTPPPPEKNEDKELPPVKERFSADVVMCIDATGSMSGIINTVKSNALQFYPDLKRESRKYGKDIESMRIKVVAFRDYDPTMSRVGVFRQSDFLAMPEKEKEFESFISEIDPLGGFDLAELGVDAIGMAVKSDWSNDKDTKKVIMLWTDAPTKPLSASSYHGFESFDGLVNEWNRNTKNNKIFFFVPEDPSWSRIAPQFNNSIVKNVASNQGLTDLDYEDILKMISEDI